MGARDHSKILIVEGQDDKFSVISLMKHHVDWPEAKDQWPVYVEVGSSAGEILRQGYLTAHLKASLTETVGVMLDADDRSAGRYQRVRDLFRELFPALPERIPEDGLIAENADQKRLGVWLMPDNASEGCMEVFLKYLVPRGDEAIWHHAVDSVKIGRSLGAPCREAHIAKAELFTWLARQDPPGYSPGIALTKKILDPHSEYAATFVGWFKNLYAL